MFVFGHLCTAVVYDLDCVQAHLCVQSDSVTRSHSCAVEGVTSPVESVSNWCNGRKALSMYADARTGSSCEREEINSVMAATIGYSFVYFFLRISFQKITELIN